MDRGLNRISIYTGRYHFRSVQIIESLAVVETNQGKESRRCRSVLLVVGRKRSDVKEPQVTNSMNAGEDDDHVWCDETKT